MHRRVMLPLALIMALSIAVLPGGIVPSSAQGTGTGPRTITGSYTLTNPIYPLIGADVDVVLYELTGNVLFDYNFYPPVEGQVSGQIAGNIASGNYTLTLPETPQGTSLDFDGDPATPPAVQVFAIANYIEYLGELDMVDPGESPLVASVYIDPLGYAITHGTVLVWSAQDGEAFPGSLGPDGALFTSDDTLLTLPAGWSVIDLSSDPFTIIRDETVDMPLLESLGELKNYSAEDPVTAWNMLFERIRETYPMAEDKNIDWDALYADITPRVEAAESTLDYHLAIARLGAYIPDGHLSYFSVDVAQAFLLGGVGIGQMVVTDDKEIVITNIQPGLPAEAAGIVEGDVLVEVDGTPALRFLEQTPLLIASASTPHSVTYWRAATMLLGPIGSRVEITVRQANGAERTTTLVREPDVSALMLAATPEDSGARVIEGRLLDSGVGYIAVRDFAADVSLADAWFEQELQALIDAGATGIILDLRFNTGGLVDLAMAIAGRFFPEPVRIGDLYYADGDGGFAYRGYIETLAYAPYYDGPVVVLVDEMTTSAGELFAYSMTLDDRAIVVGHTPTNGSTGEISDGQYVLPGDLSLQIPTGRIADPDGGATLIEGTGVQPDIVVPRTRASLLSPADEVLEAAEAALLAQ
ncbi:MAG: PDZ domain-containing protein [Chloroflexi bacterium]|nr:PDZ domain-containing protein [Chloroflexota bacterium]